MPAADAFCGLLLEADTVHAFFLPSDGDTICGPYVAICGTYIIWSATNIIVATVPFAFCQSSELSAPAYVLHSSMGCDLYQIAFFTTTHREFLR